MIKFNLFTRLLASRREKREQRLWNDTRRRIQMREFEGKVYIAIDDIPLVPSTDIEQLEEVRNTIYRYWL